MLRSLLALMACALFLSLAQAQNTSIPPSDPNIVYTGRFDFSNPEQPSFSMVSTSIKLRFEGTGIEVELAGAAQTSFIYVIIDGQANPLERQILEVPTGNGQIQRFQLASGLTSGVHEVELVKLDEFNSKVVLHGFRVTGGDILPPPERPDLLFEFYGDSNPAGTSTWDVLDRSQPESNGGYYTYPGITARLLQAEFMNNSGGGSGITTNAWWNLVQFHDRIHWDEPRITKNIWNYADNQMEREPNAVIINLGANDSYSGLNYGIIEGWKNFILTIRQKYYPNAHIVLANSYGWSYDEPTQFHEQAMRELEQLGETNVSYVQFPWFWGQGHALINEHAGFANILARHLHEKLNLPGQVPQSDLSSLTQFNEIHNGSFEVSTVPGVADGWRPFGQVNLVQNASIAAAGEHFLAVEANSFAQHPMPAEAGEVARFSAAIRGPIRRQTAVIKLLFKDRAQQTISTVEKTLTVSQNWQTFDISGTVPNGSWSVWVILEAGNNSTIYYDQVTSDFATSIGRIESEPNRLELYPNPATEWLMVQSSIQESYLIYDMQGHLININPSAQINVQDLAAGMYMVRGQKTNQMGLFIKRK